MKPRSVLLLSIVACEIACLSIGWVFLGWVVEQTDGERLTVTVHWAAWAMPIAWGALAFLAGVVLLLDRGLKKKSRRGAWVLVVVGLVWAVLLGLTLPFEEDSADPEFLVIREGLLGRGISRTVELRGVERIEIYKERRKSSSGGGGRRRGGRGRGGSGSHIVTIAEFTYSNGETERVLMDSPLREPILEHTLQLSRQHGVTVDDRRDDFER